MEVLQALGFILFVLLLATLIVPWRNLGRISQLSREVEALRGQLERVIAFLDQERRQANLKGDPQTPKAANASVAETAPTPGASPSGPPASPSPSPAAYTPKPSPPPLGPIRTIPASPTVNTTASSVYSENDELPKSVERKGFEEQFGSRLPVWIGGIALAFAGFFMVKYSIDEGWLTPMVRVVLGILFGFGLVALGYWMQGKQRLADGERIAQSLTGAGIADLYFCLFAATNLYDLIPVLVGFASMAVVTALAVVLSLRHGYPIALLGLVGGFLTPALVGSEDPQAPLLFTYLYIVVTGLMVIIRKQNWWWMALPTVFGSFIWVCVWMLGTNSVSEDALWLGLFLIAVNASVAVALLNPDEAEAEPAIAPILGYTTLGIGLILMGVITAEAGFGLMEWLLFGLLSIGSVVLTWQNEKLYRVAPWLSMAVNLVMLMVWSTADDSAFAWTITLFGLFYVISGCFLQARCTRRIEWAGLTSSAALAYYLLANYKLGDSILTLDIPYFWGLLAATLAVASAYAVRRVWLRIPDEDAGKQKLLAVYAFCGSSFVSIALTIEVDFDFLPVAIAGQVMATAWIYSRVNVHALRWISGILLGVFGFLISRQIHLLIDLAAYGVLTNPVGKQEYLYVYNPTFHLGLPALLFLLASYFLRRRTDDALVKFMEAFAVVLIGTTCYYLTRRIFHIGEEFLTIKAGFIERAVVTNVLFFCGSLAIFVGKRTLRQAVVLGGCILFCTAVTRVLISDVFLQNPLWTEIAVGSYPVFNGLLLAYALPIVWLCWVTHELDETDKRAWIDKSQGLILLLAFVFISLNVRQWFHGSHLTMGITTNAEVYTYSIAWLAFGLGLLFFGTHRQNKMIRMASLGVMILTVGKVFLYDASELEGLFRVFSFLGLGLCLLGLSWFYSRYVFVKGVA